MSVSDAKRLKELITEDARLKKLLAESLLENEVTREFDRLATTRGLPRIVRTNNALEFCGRAMLTWAH